MIELLFILFVSFIFFLILNSVGKAKIIHKIIGSWLIGYGTAVSTPPYPYEDIPLFIIFILTKGVVKIENILSNIFNFQYFIDLGNSFIGTDLYLEYMLFAIISGIILVVFGVMLSGVSLKNLFKKFLKGPTEKMKIFIISTIIILSLLIAARITHVFSIDNTWGIDETSILTMFSFSFFLSSLIFLVLLLLEEANNLNVERELKNVMGVKK